jgi:glycosyltransferase involved in cell wall biosynthesis
MQTERPDVSVIIAAYKAEAFIATALQSVLAQLHRSFEVVVAPDDDGDYRFLATGDPRIRVLESGPGSVPPTGPAATRNRALAAARGRFIAVLDADDYWSPNYLARLLPLAEKCGLAFGRTIVADCDGTERRSIPHQAAVTGTVGYEDFATAYGSLHAVVKFDAVRRWYEHLAEDVLFDVESLALAGGSAPYAADAHYHLRIRAQSTSHGTHFINGIDAGYEAIITRIDQGGTLIPAAQIAPAIAVFRAWQAMNAHFSRDYAQDPSLEFHAFIADRVLPPNR